MQVSGLTCAHLTVCFGRFKKADFGNQVQKKKKKQKKNRKTIRSIETLGPTVLQVETGVEDGESSLI